MVKHRLEAFSDGVLAIIITIMVLELNVPHGSSLKDLAHLIPSFINYMLSFIYLAIYWNNHHHMFQIIKKIDGRVLLTNGLLLFWLSLVPFATAWSGETHFAKIPVMLYGIILLLAGFSYQLLTQSLIALCENEELSTAINKDAKGKISIVLYAVALPICYVNQHISLVIYLLVAIMWIIPDKRIEKIFSQTK
ncbi:MAG: DUF1211 domain-containing protein [Bdellovibrionales bacterium]|nr:DUF1211 domain-containing protein [Bdellovibrionales bacterium]